MAMSLALSTRTRDFHPLDCIDAGRTKQATLLVYSRGAVPRNIQHKRPIQLILAFVSVLSFQWILFHIYPHRRNDFVGHFFLRTHRRNHSHPYSFPLS
jgi:hypothetical protein